MTRRGCRLGPLITVVALLTVGTVQPLRAETEPSPPQSSVTDHLAAAIDALREAARGGAQEAIEQARQALDDVDRDLADLQSRIEQDPENSAALEETRLRLEVLRAQAALALHRLSQQATDTLEQAQREAAEALAKLDAWLRDQRRERPPSSPAPGDTLDI